MAETNDNDQLTPPRYTVAITALLATNGNVAEAAREAGIADSTMRRYLKQKDFRALLREAQSEALALAISRLAGGAKIAADTLVSICENTEVTAGIRVQAAAVLLSQLRSLSEQYDLSLRLEELEARLGVGGNR